MPGQTLYAEISRARARRYRSAPFQLVADHGTSASIRAVPVFFTFHIVTGVEDQLLAVQGQFKLMNFNWAPYKASPDGLDVPMPRGFKGAIVAERDQAVAGVEAGVGFRVPRPLPPAGQTMFKGAFSLPVSDGNVELGAGSAARHGRELDAHGAAADDARRGAAGHARLGRRHRRGQDLS